MNNSEKTKKWFKTRNGLTGRIYQDQKKLSRKRKHQINYSLQEFRAWVYSQKNFEKLYQGWIASDYARSESPSIDRTDSSKGYSLPNIKLMKWNENHKKKMLDRIQNPGKNNSSGITGVNKVYKRNLWVARIMIRKRILLKYFSKFEDALSHRKMLEARFLKYI